MTIAFKELVQVSMLVKETQAMEIAEVTLSFERSTSHQDRMPTLRSFIRVNDWERVEQVFADAATSAENPQVHRFSSPLLLRISNSRPRAYLRAKNVSVSLDEEEADFPARFCVNISAFDLRNSCQKDRDLASVSMASSRRLCQVSHPGATASGDLFRPGNTAAAICSNPEFWLQYQVEEQGNQVASQTPYQAIKQLNCSLSPGS